MTPDELISTIQSLGASEDVVSKVREYIACQDDRERLRRARAAERQRLYMKRKMTPADITDISADISKGGLISADISTPQNSQPIEIANADVSTDISADISKGVLTSADISIPKKPQPIEIISADISSPRARVEYIYTNNTYTGYNTGIGVGGVGGEPTQPAPVKPKPEPKPKRKPIGKAPMSAAREAAFEAFWQLYPRKDDKAGARDVFAKLDIKPQDIPAIMAGVQRYREQCRGSERRFIKLGDGWLRHRRWEDEGVDSNVIAVPRSRFVDKNGYAITA